MAAPRRNKNASGKRVDRDRIAINLSISKKNGLLELFSEYLTRQGIDPTDENIKQVASDAAYHHWGEWLKREIEMSEGAIIA
jgi:hypothetical protein